MDEIWNSLVILNVTNGTFILSFSLCVEDCDLFAKFFQENKKKKNQQ